MNDEFERTYEVIDLDDPPQLANENHTHYIFHCPNCLEKHGSDDEVGKLYFDKTDLKGICFRCNTAFYPSTKENSSGLIDTKLNRIAEEVSERLLGKEVTEPPPMAFNFEDLKPEDVRYLRSRHQFLPMLAPILGLKSWYGSNRGIVVPYLYKNYVATFQVRFDTKDPKRRYFIPTGSMKIPYSPEHLLTNFRLGNDNNITICEGWADAVALWVMDYSHPLAVQGSILSDSQVPMIRRLMPDKVTVIMDDIPKSNVMADDIKKKIPSVSEVAVKNFGDDVDPEEHLKELVKDPVNMRKFFNNTMSILKERVK